MKENRLRSKELSKLNRKLSNTGNELFELFSVWFFGELAFTLLPIGIILGINLAFKETLANIFLLPDWSFGAIVLYGVAIGLLLEIKTKYQKDSSYKVFTGTRLFTIFVIASSVVLVLVLLIQKEVTIDSQFVSTSQMFLFLNSILAVFVAVQTKLKFLNAYKKSTKEVKPRILRDYFRYALEETEQHLLECHRMVKTNAESIFDVDTRSTAIEIDNDKEKLIALIENIEKQVVLVKSELQDILKTHKQQE